MAEMALIDQTDAAASDMVIEVDNIIQDMEIDDKDEDYAKFQLFMKQERAKEKAKEQHQKTTTQVKDHRGAKKTAKEKSKSKRTPSTKKTGKGKQTKQKGKDSDADNVNDSKSAKDQKKKGNGRKKKGNTKRN